jgi:N-terminal domain of (some) glycogen debranching enzymes
VSLIRLKPRPTTRYVSRGRTVLATNADGQVRPERDVGLFVRETRLLSRYEYRIDDRVLEPSALSNIEQHTSLAYYFVRSPGAPPREPDHGSGLVPLATEETLEVRVFRSVGEGLHEDLHLTNFSRSPSTFKLTLIVEADFADYVESGGARQQHGESSIRWAPDRSTVTFDYRARSERRDADPSTFVCGLVMRVKFRRPTAPPNTQCELSPTRYAAS